MKVIGKSYSTNDQGIKLYTLFVADDFSEYNRDVSAGRGCEGQRCDSIYAGSYDCSTIKVGMEVDIMYERAIVTAKGTFQPIKKIELIGK